MAKKRTTKPAKRKATAQKASAKRAPAKRAAAKAAPAKRAAAKLARAADAGGLNLQTAGPSYTVNDLDKSLAWYRDVLGCSVKDRWEDGGKLQGVEMSAGAVSFWIGQDDWKKGRDRVKGEGFRLHCTTAQNVDAIADRIKANGGSLMSEPRDDWGMRAFAIADPDGFKITIAAKLK